jgi:hypothetical protein
LHTKARGEAVQARHGRGTTGWTATHGCQLPTEGGAARVRRRRRWVAGAAGVSTWRTGRGSGWRFYAGGPTAHGPAGVRLPRRSGPRGSHGEHARRGAARRDVVRCGAPAQNSSKYPTLNWIFSNFQTELHQGLTTNLAHHTTLYKFCKGSRGLDQRTWHKLQGKLTEISAPVSSESRR